MRISVVASRVDYQNADCAAFYDAEMAGEKNHKSLPEPEASAVRQFLRRFVAKYKNQTAAGKVLGVSQGTVSNVLTGKATAGVTVLVALHRRSQSSLPEILGYRLADAPKGPRNFEALRMSTAWDELLRDTRGLIEKMAAVQDLELDEWLTVAHRIDSRVRGGRFPVQAYYGITLDRPSVPIEVQITESRQANLAAAQQ